MHGWTDTGRTLPTVNVPADQFAAMKWVDTQWVGLTNIKTGTTLRDSIREAMMDVCILHKTEVTKYQHTGWRMDIPGAGCCYIHKGGALGADNVTVDLYDNLYAYDFNRSADMGDLEAVLQSWIAMRNVLPEKLAVPGLAFTYLAPLQAALAKSGHRVDFVMFIQGRTGTGKSVASSLLLNHFANYDGMDFPASFNSTYNYVGELAFTLKDSLIVVDDYRPSSSKTERHKMEETAHKIIELFANNAARNKLNSDSSMRATRMPRCICIMTGEDVPTVGESGEARLYQIHLEKGCI